VEWVKVGLVVHTSPYRHIWKGVKLDAQFQYKNLKEIDRLLDLSTDGRKILKMERK
jgi:hypothetical protein